MRSLPITAIALLTASLASADSLTILHTNDFHSRIEPINKYDSGCKPEDNDAGKCFGGSARLITAVRAAREAAPNSLLVDGGDQFQGTLFYTHYKGQAAAELMNVIGYEAMTVGNHEFDDGPEVLRDFVKAVDFPILMSNADVSAEPALEGVIQPSMIIEKAGVKYGLIGLTPENTDEMASPGPNIRFLDPITAVRAEIESLEKQGVNRIIVLSHSGYHLDLDFASQIDGIDVIVGGHSHSLLSNSSDRASGPYPTWVRSPGGGKTAIVQAYAYGKFLGRLDVTFDDAGTVVEAVGEPILIDGKVVEDSTLKARIAELAVPLEEVRNRVVAESSGPINGDRNTCRSQECEMGNLVADAMLDRVKGQGIEIAIQNGGGLRASIDQGPVTMGEVLTVLPFQNVLSTFKLTGANVKAALENGVSQIEEGAGRFAQVAGIRYSFDAKAEVGSRITKVEIM
ncbi:MAG: bifunctional metallophosphatase/5'-nucleotidase, partial [Pseudomonadota bacterium]